MFTRKTARVLALTASISALTAITFAAIATPPCPGDFNFDGALTVQDIFDFLAAWFSQSPTADVNNSGVVTVQDIFDFLAAWFAGCP